MNLIKILSITCITCSSLAGIITGLYYYLTNTSYTQVNIKGISDSETMFFELLNNDVAYNMIDPFLDNSGFMLTRFFMFNENEPSLVQTLLYPNYTQMSPWELIFTDFKNKNLVIEKKPNNIQISVDGIYLNIDFYLRKPVKFNNYTIVNYSLNSEFTNEPILNLLKQINNPNVTLLNLNNTKSITTMLPPSNINLNCFMELAFNNGATDTVSTGMCNGYTVVGVPGTNFQYLNDIISDLNGLTFDNFKHGFDSLKNFDFKVYDFCAGYSLGGGIVKYMSLHNYCRNIITFGSPLTHQYNFAVPIIQYINAVDDDGCCQYSWFSTCLQYGMYLQDPVTLILTGTHQNPTYVGNKKNNNCVGNIAYTVWKQRFNLHLATTYFQNLPS